MSEFGFVVGDACSPKYLMAKKLNLNLGQKQILKLYWQATYLEYFNDCLTEGLFEVIYP